MSHRATDLFDILFRVPCLGNEKQYSVKMTEAIIKLKIISSKTLE